mmetsp:Transcript_148879/g.387141  ORF Transcript_148879/g.387141 Transcript_148879/m.387141 type:complete len:232 (-) Transcript_148879:427-1122(-)
MALGVAQCALVLHQEGLWHSVAGPHAHRATVGHDTGGEQATERHVRGEVAVGIHDKMRHLLRRGRVLSRIPKSVQDCATLAALLRRLELAILDEERDFLVDGLLQADQLHVVPALRLHDLSREAQAVVWAAVVDREDLPGLALLPIEEPLQLRGLHAQQILTVFVFLFGPEPVLLAVHCEDARHVVRPASLEFEFGLGATDGGNHHGRGLRRVLVSHRLDLLQGHAGGQDL